MGVSKGWVIGGILMFVRVAVTAAIDAFLCLDGPEPAILVPSLISVGLFFWFGYAWVGRTGPLRLRLGTAIVAAGLALSAITICSGDDRLTW